MMEKSPGPVPQDGGFETKPETGDSYTIFDSSARSEKENV